MCDLRLPEHLFFKGKQEKKANKTINITDDGDYAAFAASVPNACHKVIFIRQDKNDLTGPVAINLTDASGTYSFTMTGSPGVSALDDDGHKDYGNISLITNLDKTDLSNDGHLYSEEALTRVYDIKVELYQGANLITSLESTKTEGKTPTPTPTPTTTP